MPSGENESRNEDAFMYIQLNKVKVTKMVVDAHVRTCVRVLIIVLSNFEQTIKSSLTDVQN